MRAKALRGFCISPGVYAEAGQVVELTDTFYAYMHGLLAVEPAPEEPSPEAPKEDAKVIQKPAGKAAPQK